MKPATCSWRVGRGLEIDAVMLGIVCCHDRGDGFASRGKKAASNSTVSCRCKFVEQRVRDSDRLDLAERRVSVVEEDDIHATVSGAFCRGGDLTPCEFPASQEVAQVGFQEAVVPLVVLVEVLTLSYLLERGPGVLVET